MNIFVWYTRNWTFVRPWKFLIKNYYFPCCKPMKFHWGQLWISWTWVILTMMLLFSLFRKLHPFDYVVLIFIGSQRRINNCVRADWWSNCGSLLWYSPFHQTGSLWCPWTVRWAHVCIIKFCPIILQRCLRVDSNIHWINPVDITTSFDNIHPIKSDLFSG